MLTASAILCLAMNVFYEARGEPIEGRHAVAQVAFNRADRNPKKVCEAIYEPGQFSWTKKHRTPRAPVLKKAWDRQAWDDAKSIAFHTLSGNIQDFTNGATHFHAKGVRPSWRRALQLVAVIGRHKFYA